MKILASLVLFGSALASASGQLTPAQLTPAQRTQVATIANDVLAKTGVPSASVAIVQGSRVVYAEAFGKAHIAPDKAATAAMAYPVGSISKQFTASAALLLQQQGKLSIDDPVAKYFPELTRANEVTIRNLLTMTSGYEDFAPQDYIIPAWLQPTTPVAVVREWTGKPLDFTPGAEWQYSNTNYLLVGLIVQKVAGEPLAEFIRKHVLARAHIDHVVQTYDERDKLPVTGYVSVALQPVREQPLEASGWYFGDGDLAMPASSLAQWDICQIERCLLSAASYDEQQKPFVLTAGTNQGQATRYGLGIFVGTSHGVRQIEHSGEVGGFVAENVVFPEQKAAIVVLTNEVASGAASDIARALTPIVLGDAWQASPVPSDTLAIEVRGILDGLAKGTLDRTLLTSNCSSYFSPAAMADFKAELAPLGTISAMARTRTSQRGGMTFNGFKVTFGSGTVLNMNTYTLPDGRIEQFLITGKE